jgi:hypothetical protein
VMLVAGLHACLAGLLVGDLRRPLVLLGQSQGRLEFEQPGQAILRVDDW